MFVEVHPEPSRNTGEKPTQLLQITVRRAGQWRVIRYTRGHIEIIDRDSLSKTACERYAAVRTHYERLRQI